MTLIILHLSDIHIQSNEDAVLGRTEPIIGALRSHVRDKSGILILVTGDVAYSGRLGKDWTQKASAL
jgi:hypothetical protein